MAQTSHKVAGIYPDHASARAAVDALQQAGIGEDAIAMVDMDNAPPPRPSRCTRRI